jgi:hypothetical protein
MKKTLLCTVIVLIAALLLPAVAGAVMIRNVSNQALLLPIPGKGALQLAPGGTAKLTDADYASPAVQNYIRSGHIRAVTAEDRSPGNIMVRNVSGQVLLVQVPGKGTLQLAPNATATLTQADYASQAVQNYIRGGHIRAVTAEDRSSGNVMVRNVSGQVLLVQVPGKGTLQFVPNATVTLTRADYASPAVQNYIRSGHIRVVAALDTSSAMVMIRNVSNQVLFIPIPGKGTLQLAPGATASITQDEWSTPAVQNLVRNGQVAVMKPAPPQGVNIR